MTSFTVSSAETGQKLLQALERRTEEPTSNLHKWIRTGQVRVNGARRKAFDRIEAGDEIRLPPFARLRIHGDDRNDATTRLGAVFTIVGRTADIAVIEKPQGLAVQPGARQSDSVVSRIRMACADVPFLPAPAHRLDKDTSGLLCIGLTHAGLRDLSDAFAGRRGRVTKEYLAWCVGRWTDSTHIRTSLGKRVNGDGIERVEETNSGKTAEMDVTPVRTALGATLIHIRLLTGRTHQIRVQLAASGHPVVGDGKYGGRKAFTVNAPIHGMLLHAARIILDGRRFEAVPPWDGGWAAKPLPEPYPPLEKR